MNWSSHSKLPVKPSSVWVNSLFTQHHQSSQFALSHQEHSVTRQQRIKNLVTAAFLASHFPWLLVSLESLSIRIVNIKERGMTLSVKKKRLVTKAKILNSFRSLRKKAIQFPHLTDFCFRVWRRHGREQETSTYTARLQQSSGSSVEKALRAQAHTQPSYSTLHGDHVVILFPKLDGQVGKELTRSFRGTGGWERQINRGLLINSESKFKLTKIKPWV